MCAADGVSPLSRCGAGGGVPCCGAGAQLAGVTGLAFGIPDADMMSSHGIDLIAQRQSHIAVKE